MESSAAQMTYATRQDLIDRFGETELFQLTDRVNMPPTTVDDIVTGRALGDADAAIDGYVGKKYTLPLATVPPMLVKIASDLARYYLHGEAAGKDSIVTRNADAALSWLKDVSRGLIALDDGGEPPAQAGGGSIKANPSSRVFRRSTLEGL